MTHFPLILTPEGQKSSFFDFLTNGVKIVMHSYHWNLAKGPTPFFAYYRG